MKRTALKRHTPIKAYTRLQSTTRLAPGKVMRRGVRGARSTEPPSREDLERFAAMRKLGCLACRMNGTRGYVRVVGTRLEVHHLLNGGVRIGHHAVICLCRFHHQGDKWPELDQGYAHVSKYYGPSLARESRAFYALYGNNDRLLTFQNELLRETTR
ncbi:Ref family recombination enhancement nuclease [Dyella japonica]|uniref:Uncharacterized protein n=1 Tax=Dyella japonica DSM 16301 TaxID=1440762 RepID=A0A0G9H7H9_9GAMM|nr:Ref family recombination enhancement nuclease [Dyella japonica]KLD65441.1 hypothetical protein Y882_02675 [Dyella japonica DSM 16301]